MCGGCPGGKAIPTLSAHVTLRGIKSDVVNELNLLLAPQLKVAAFKDHWIAKLPTGGQTIYPSLEELTKGILARKSTPEQNNRALRFHENSSKLTPSELASLAPKHLVLALLGLE